MKNKKNPIGIFDSGIGGLTVCKAIRDLLPTEDIIYFGDTARFPYGTRSKETIIRYSEEIVNYLLTREVKIIVIACNTSSAIALDYLNQKHSLPILGVIETGAKAACQKIKNNKVGIIGTRATIKSKAYSKAISKLKPKTEIFQQQATLFVPLIEEGLMQGKITELVIMKYLKKIYQKGVRTLILGCTHFPLLKKPINKLFPDLNLIDTGTEIALETKKILKKENLLAKSNRKGNIELYSSDITTTTQKVKKVFFGNQAIKINKMVIGQ